MTAERITDLNQDPYLADVYSFIDLSHFIQCLSDIQNIRRKEAFEQVLTLIQAGLTLYVSATMEPALLEKEIPLIVAERAVQIAVENQSLQAQGTSISVKKKDGSTWHDPLCLTRIQHEQASLIFDHVFKKTCPWPYPEQLADTTEKVDIADRSDAALGAQVREQLKRNAQNNKETHDARKQEWDRWKEEANFIQSKIEITLSKSELARRIKKNLKLPDSTRTIRNRL